MIIKREATRKVEEEIVNEWVPSQGNQAPPQEQVPLGGQAKVNPPFMLDREISFVFLILTKILYTQAQGVKELDNRKLHPAWIKMLAPLLSIWGISLGWILLCSLGLR